MSTRLADRRRLAPALAACALLAACSSDPEATAPPAPAESETTTPSAAPSMASPPPRAHNGLGPRVSLDVAGDLQRVLDGRAQALRDRDRPGFVSTLTTDPELLAMEERYFDNLAQLPLATFGYQLVASSLVRSAGGYSAVVEVTLQLAGYDAVPARTLDRVRFVPAGRGYRIASTTDPAWERRNLGVQQPWDIESIRVREGVGVLGVFDTATAAQAATLVGAAERGVADVAARVPYDDWSGTAVFYTLSDPAFLDSFDDLPGGDPDALDGVAFSVPAGEGDPATAATRFVMNPTVLSRRGKGLERLVRHELVHVAVGTHDDRAPVWLSEGIAEWVSVQALAPQERRVPARALAAAAERPVTMPSDASFNDDDAAEHYALAWWVCEWIATTYGAEAPWQVLDAFTTLEGADDRAVVRQVLKMSVDELARRGAELMVTTYAPEPDPPADPSESPTTTG